MEETDTAAGIAKQDELLKIRLSVANLEDIRMMLRVLTVQRLAEVVTQARIATTEDVSNSRVLTDILKFTDIYNNYDHHVLCALQTATAFGDKEIDVPMTAASLKFYQAVAVTEFDVGVVRSDVYEKMVLSCRRAQKELATRLGVEAPAEKAVSNMMADTGVN